MRQLVYVSAATWTLSPHEMDGLLRSARRNNPAQGVTGMLLCIDRGFLQILEGPPAGVEKIFRKIETDKRHSAVRILIDEQVTARLFSRWSMGFDRPDPQQRLQAGVFTATREAIEAAIPTDKAIATAHLVRNFYTVNAPRDFA
jgi:hypothetical protein